MSTTTGNQYLDHGFSDDSGSDGGYDSEAAELSRNARVTAVASSSRRSTKKRKLSHNEQSDSEAESVEASDVSRRIEREQQQHRPKSTSQLVKPQQNSDSQPSISSEARDSSARTSNAETAATAKPLDPGSKLKSELKPRKKDRDKNTTPGVIYLSSLPPYLKPSALRNLLQQRGFDPITRLFLTPASKTKATGSSSRQRYTEGWIEFSSKKTARHCAETLNARPVGGKKGGFYHDDIWNMKYLRGLGWDELMAGVREERREEESRRDEERRVVAGETKRFLEGVELGKRDQGMKLKRSKSKKRKNADADEDDEEEEEEGGGEVEVKRTWRQFEVKGKNSTGQNGHAKERISDEARQVLGKIF